MNTGESTTGAKTVRPPPCMSTTASGDAVSLTLHFSNGDLLSLPWSRYLGACLTKDKLVISFAEREVEVHGRNLNKLIEAIESASLTGLRELPAAYATLAGTESYISRLNCGPAQNRENRSSAA